MRDQKAFFWWIAATFIAAVQWSLASRFVSAASDDCSNYVLAQDANVVLTWTLQSGVDAFTRISHTSEALLLPSSASRVVIIGGIEYGSAQPAVTNPLLVYNVDTNTFAKPQDSILSSLSPTTKTTSSRIVDDKFVSPASRTDHASFITSANVVYLFGGQNTAFLNDTWRLCVDDSTAAWDQLVASSDAVTVAATPVPRIGHSSTQVFENATMIGAIVYGGISDAYVELDGLHMVYITKTTACSNWSPKITWRMLPMTTAVATADKPAPRSYHSASVTSKLFLASKIACFLVFGGKSTLKGIIFDELWRLCPSSSSSSSIAVEQQMHVWELLTSLGTTPGVRCGAGVVFVDEGKLALAGGSYTFPNDFLRDTWELNVNATQWIRLHIDDDFAPPRRGHSLTFFPTSRLMVLFGGKDRYAVVQKRIETTLYAAPYCAMGFRITLCESSGNYVCIPCPAGLYLQSGTRNCLPCSEGTFSSIGAAECTKCPAGTYSTVVGKTSDSPCTRCPVGTSSNALGATSLAACALCSPGTFAASSGSTACSTCAPGTYSMTVLRPAPSAVPRCAAGSYSPYTGSISCFACPKGFYSDSGAGNCTACPINTFSNTVGTASISGCQKCSSVSFTTAIAQTRCTVCALGSSYIGSKCQLCSAGSYASENTQGACLPCPKGSYAPVAGTTQCRACPEGTTTAATGVASLDGCVYCTTGYALDGASNCALCAAGTFPSSPGICSTCAPGGYTSSATEAAAQQSGDCRQCVAMTFSSARGATHCDVCGAGSFSLTGCGNCIACGLTQQQLVGCKSGRNGLLCSGNGECIYGGCACTDAWTGADCSVPLLLATGSNTSASTSSRAVLYFPASQQNLTLFAFPITTTEANIAIQVARSGATDSSLRAKMVWLASNFSSSSTTTSGFPRTLTFAAGETIQTVTIALSSLTPRSGCRFLTFALTGTSDDPSSSSVSVESDNSITLCVDDMNGVDGGKSGRSIDVNYVGDFSIQPTANVTLDRVVSTQVTLSPSISSGASVMLQDQRMNILVAIDRRSTTSASSLVHALPALLAALQTRYQVDSSEAIQMGFLKGNTSSISASSLVTFYPNLGDFFLAAQALNQSSTRQETMSYAWITAALTRNSSAWLSMGRRFLWIIDDTSQLMNSSSNPSTTAMACQNTFDGSAINFTGATDVVQGITYESIAVLPSRVLDAHVAKDNTLPSAINVLKDPSSLVTSAQVRSFAQSGGVGSLPVLSLVLKSIPSNFQSSTLEILLGIPGVYQLQVHVVEPTHACFPPLLIQLPDPVLLSGWMDAWSLSSVAEIKRKWKSPSSTIQLRLYQDNSLFRTAMSAILAIADLQSARLTLTRQLPGLDFCAGLKLAIRGYVRAPQLGKDQSARCQLSMAMITANATVLVAIPHESSKLAGKSWEYGWEQRVVISDLDSVNVTLDCNTSAPGVTIEWSTLGLLPDLDFACKCPCGFFNDVLSSGNAKTAGSDDSTCVRCPTGSYCAAGIKRRCPDGSFSFGKSASCEVCREGWICANGLARLCNPGTFASPSFTCEVCPAGYACRNGKKVSCLIGTFSLWQASECQSCPPGTISRIDAYVCQQFVAHLPRSAWSFLSCNSPLDILSFVFVLLALQYANVIQLVKHPTTSAITV